MHLRTYVPRTHVQFKGKICTEFTYGVRKLPMYGYFHCRRHQCAPHVVTLHPQMTCSCPAICQCYHIRAARQPNQPIPVATSTTNVQDIPPRSLTLPPLERRQIDVDMCHGCNSTEPPVHKCNEQIIQNQILYLNKIVRILDIRT